VPPGISVFDLIMPWKNDIVIQNTSNSEKNKLSKLITCQPKNTVETVDLAKYANDVQAILINPPWESCHSIGKSSKKKAKTLSIDNFKKLNIPTSVMKDGLVFIWVEKDIIS
jgi:hypothetical protein